jgi:S1-C subfamily serine protease
VAAKTTLRVRAVEKGGPADQAGIAPGDLIIAADGVAIAGVDDLLRALDGERIGKPVGFTLLRGGRLMPLLAVPSARAG